MIRFVVPYLIYSIAALFGIFLQSELFSYLQIFDAKPDLLLLIVVLGALKSDWKNGVAAGFVVGFWIDLLNGGYFGTNMIVYACTGALFGFIGTKFPKRSYEGYFFSAVVAAFFSGFLQLIVFGIVAGDIPVARSIGGIILPMVFYTSLIAFFCLPLIWLHRRNTGRKIGSIDLLGGGIVLVHGDDVIDMKKVMEERREKRSQKRHERLTAERRRRESERKTARSVKNRNGNSVRDGQGRKPRPSGTRQQSAQRGPRESRRDSSVYRTQAPRNKTPQNSRSRRGLEDNRHPRRK